jgi:hypothetical protein
MSPWKSLLNPMLNRDGISTGFIARNVMGRKVEVMVLEPLCWRPDREI